MQQESDNKIKYSKNISIDLKPEIPDLSSEEICHNSIRISLSDETGVLRITKLESESLSQCSDGFKKLTDYLVGRPLAEIDIPHTLSLNCANNKHCIGSLANLLQDYIDMFA